MKTTATIAKPRNINRPDTGSVARISELKARLVAAVENNQHDAEADAELRAEERRILAEAEGAAELGLHLRWSMDIL